MCANVRGKRGPHVLSTGRAAGWGAQRLGAVARHEARGVTRLRSVSCGPRSLDARPNLIFLALLFYSDWQVKISTCCPLLDWEGRVAQFRPTDPSSRLCRCFTPLLLLLEGQLRREALVGRVAQEDLPEGTGEPRSPLLQDGS